MKNLLLASTVLAAIGAAPAHATLQIAFTDGTNVVTCADGQACDLAGPTNNIIILNETVGAFHIIGTVAASSSALGDDNLQFSTSLIQNTGPTWGTSRSLLATTISSGRWMRSTRAHRSTFNNATGSGASTLRFFADPANGQPAGVGLNIPGALLFTATGTPTDRPGQLRGHQHFAIHGGWIVLDDGDGELGAESWRLNYGLQREHGDDRSPGAGLGDAGWVRLMAAWASAARLASLLISRLGRTSGRS